MPIDIPDQLQVHVTAALGEAGRQWLDSLPGIIGACCERWQLTLLEPFKEGEFNLVVPGTAAGGLPVVLKAAPPFPDGEFYSEAAYLRRRNGSHCVKLYAEDLEDRVILLERAVPGASSVDRLAENEQGVVRRSAELLKLLDMPPPNDGSPTIPLSRWFSNLERARGTGFPHEYAEKALSFYKDLSKNTPERHLHGDFHPGNIVTAERERFLVIDAKGLTGPAGYDAAVYLNNLHRWHEERGESFENMTFALVTFSAALGVTEQDLRKWAYAVQVLGSWWIYDEMPALYSGSVAKADVWNV